NEICHLREWDEKREQDWDLRKYPTHDSFYRFMSELNALYLTQPALSERDYCEDGFTWIDCHQEEKCVYAISRKSHTGELIAVFNFNDREQTYMLPEKYVEEKYEILLYTDWEKYGGSCPLSGNVMAAGTIVLEKFSGVLIKI
ncbi:MAG: alpha amylase C-terminal domain-containing protein, partial [Lachnospiraceae bacterium]|nr:alpha amylase C-terminal domain-containing protein [Lachnospiraceae bacterium]